MYENLTPGTSEYSAAVLSNFQESLARRRMMAQDALGESLGRRGFLDSGQYGEGSAGILSSALGEERGKMLELAGMEGDRRLQMEKIRLQMEHERRMEQFKADLARRDFEYQRAANRRNRAYAGAASGAGLGATIGSGLGPVGTLVGAGIGGLGGYAAGYYA